MSLFWLVWLMWLTDPSSTQDRPWIEWHSGYKREAFLVGHISPKYALFRHVRSWTLTNQFHKHWSALVHHLHTQMMPKKHPALAIFSLPMLAQSTFSRFDFPAVGFHQASTWTLGYCTTSFLQTAQTFCSAVWVSDASARRQRYLTNIEKLGSS